jgi:hypothetical protein
MIGDHARSLRRRIVVAFAIALGVARVVPGLLRVVLESLAEATPAVGRSVPADHRPDDRRGAARQADRLVTAGAR